MGSDLCTQVRSSRRSATKELRLRSASTGRGTRNRGNSKTCSSPEPSLNTTSNSATSQQPGATL
eukprot:9224113-Prorocentrum_lima.AAC.1